MSNIKLNDTVDEPINKINNDIRNISDTLNNIYQAVLTLNEDKWNTKEKKIIEEEFLPYLKKISIKYPIYLNDRLIFLKNIVQEYNENDKNIKNKINEIL